MNYQIPRMSVHFIISRKKEEECVNSYKFFGHCICIVSSNFCAFYSNTTIRNKEDCALFLIDVFGLALFLDLGQLCDFIVISSTMCGLFFPFQFIVEENAKARIF